ncbi:hypothetical protein [Dendronalium sp. ChiSLP03b]|uniref:hypothetical protein n=1 Tax=Dendronalium sp. ChiSLP03b TaxID=3075381 RepID=UPI00391A2D25
MDNNLLLSLLKNKLAETEQDAARLREIAVKAQIDASIMEALAKKIQSTIDSLMATHDKDLSAKDYQQYLEDVENVSDADVSVSHGHPTKSQSLQKFRLPKDMKRPQYKRTRGYVTIARQILANHPRGLHIDRLTDIIFETCSPDELARARNSLLAELNRGVKEGRLAKLEDSEYFLLEPKQFEKSAELPLSTDTPAKSISQFNGKHLPVNS